MNKTQKTIVDLLENSGELTSQIIKEKTGITYDTIMRNMKMLELQGIIDVNRRAEQIEDSKKDCFNTRRAPWVNYYKLHKE